MSCNFKTSTADRSIQRSPSIFALLAICLFASFSTINTVVIANDELEIRPAITTVYLVRHAEKKIDSGKDPALTDQGQFRANFLAKMFKQVPFDAVYSTDTIRTRDTAQPTAKSQGLEVVLYGARDVNYSDFLASNLGKTVLVVGHSNTIPAFVNGLLGEKKYTELDEAQYDSLFVVDVIGQHKSDKLLTIAVRLNQTVISE